MTLNQNFREDFHQLTLKIHQTSIPDKKYIDQINELYHRYESTESGDIKRQCDSSIAFIYYLNEDWQDALEIYEKMLLEPALNIHAFHLQLAAECQIRLGQAKEGLSRVKMFLLQEQTNCHDSLSLLFWLVKNLNEDETNSIYQFNYLIPFISKGFGIKMNNKNMDTKEAILYLNEQNKTSNRKYSSLLLSLKNVSKQEKIFLLKDFIDEESVGFYKGLAENALENTEKLVSKGS